MHGVHAQNYHIFTPLRRQGLGPGLGLPALDQGAPLGQSRAELPLQTRRIRQVLLEFCITPFDYAGCEGPQRAVESKLYENKLIGLSWAVIDYDGDEKEQRLLEPRHRSTPCTATPTLLRDSA